MIATYKSEIDTYKAEITLYKTKINDYKIEVNNHKAEEFRLQKRISDLEKEIEQYSRQPQIQMCDKKMNPIIHIITENDTNKITLHLGKLNSL